jgi:excisionase family DNA binding protein
MSHSRLLSVKYLLSLQEFSLLTGLSLRTINKLVANAEVRSIRVGRRRLISRNELDRFSRRDHLLIQLGNGATTRRRIESVCQKKVCR